ncbi:MAG: DNA-processing protein DprA [Actinomycetes bacterium]
MSERLPDWAEDDRLARAAWSRLAEPEDHVAGWARHLLGPVRAMQHVLSGDPLPLAVAEGRVEDAGRARRRLDRALERWRVRLDTLAPERDVWVVERLGGRLLVPGDDEWPQGLADLEARAPACLWLWGPAHLARAVERSVAVVGSRASTAYGERVAADLAAGVVSHGFTVVSGGAFGIDAAAHRGALAAGGTTVAVLACGVDRSYPKAHERLFARVRETGLVVTEAAPGSTVMRTRFLERNRLIAAMTKGTVVVEAARRSGAISTAGHAAALGRPLGAVPGPVTSPASTGCHLLLRDLDARCVTDAEEVVELVSPLGERYAPEPVLPAYDHDALEGADLRVYESLPVQAFRPVGSLSQVAGLPVAQVQGALGRLSLLGLATSALRPDGERTWRRAARGGPPSRGYGRHSVTR